MYAPSPLTVVVIAFPALASQYILGVPVPPAIPIVILPLLALQVASWTFTIETTSSGEP